MRFRRKFARSSGSMLRLCGERTFRAIEGKGSTVLEDQTMVRAEGKIVSIADRASANVAKDAQVQGMDMHESPVISGLVGMHEHATCPLFNRAIGHDSAEAMRSARGTVGSR